MTLIHFTGIFTVYLLINILITFLLEYDLKFLLILASIFLYFPSSAVTAFGIVKRIGCILRIEPVGDLMQFLIYSYTFMLSLLLLIVILMPFEIFNEVFFTHPTNSK